jgi:uncharacterized protein DUF1905
MAEDDAATFSAIVRTGPRNPYIDVPAEVTAAFAALARSGRVPVAGTLEGASVRGTLMPMRGGSQRLYLPGGLRAAAGVEVGDTVALVLRPIHPAP